MTQTNETPAQKGGDPNNMLSKLQSSTEKIKNSDKISEHNKKVLLDFKEYLQEVDDVSTGRVERPLTTWRMILENGENFKLDEADKQDILRIVNRVKLGNATEREIEESNYTPIKSLAVGTQREYLKAVNKFYDKYMEYKHDDFDGEELTVFWNLPKESKDYLDPAELPRTEHIEKLVSRCDNLRDKCAIMTLWATGCRRKELLSIQWKDVVLREDGGKVTVDEKSNRDVSRRTVPLYEAYLYLQDLKDSDHEGDNPQAYVFRDSDTDEQMAGPAVTRMLERWRNKVDIPEHVRTNPHALRKGRSVYLAKKDFSYTDLCELLGWSIGSDAPRRYLRIAEGDIDSKMRDKSENWESEDEDLGNGYHFEPVKCHECGELNKWEAENCSSCGQVLSESEIFEHTQIEEMTDELVYEVAQSQAGVDREEIKQKARELVKS